MKPLCLFASCLLAGSALAGPILVENFACPGAYVDGQPIAGVPAKPGRPGGGWEMDANLPNQNPAAFLAGKVLPKKTADPDALKVERAEREKIKEEEKAMDREARAKAEAKREAIEKGKKALANLRTIPGTMVLAPVEKGLQNIVLPLNPKEATKPPFYFSVLLELDADSQGPITLSLEDEIADLPVSISLQKPEENFWVFSAGGAQAGMDGTAIRGPLFLVVGVEEHPTERGKWIARGAINPVDARTPFKQAAALNNALPEHDPKPLVRLRIAKAPKVSGRIDEIRFGTSLRDVFP